EVDDPAASRVDGLLVPTMREDVFVVTPRVEQGVRQDGEAVEGPLLVDGLRDAPRRALVPPEDGSRKGGWRAEGVAEQATEQVGEVRPGQPLRGHAHLLPE